MPMPNFARAVLLPRYALLNAFETETTSRELAAATSRAIPKRFCASLDDRVAMARL